MTPAELQAMTKEQLIKRCLRLQERNSELDAKLKQANTDKANLAARLVASKDIPY